MKIIISGTQKQFRKIIEKYSFEVGILKDSKLKRAKPKTLKNFAGGPARVIGSATERGSMQALGGWLNKRYKWLDKPFTIKTNKEIRTFAKTYIDEISKQKNINEKKLINLVQAIVRNPILRGDYGTNSDVVAKRKGFNRLLIDTGAFFGSIKARLINENK